jgi:hypothetical protein
MRTSADLPVPKRRAFSPDSPTVHVGLRDPDQHEQRNGGVVNAGGDVTSFGLRGPGYLDRARHRLGFERQRSCTRADRSRASAVSRRGGLAALVVAIDTNNRCNTQVVRLAHFR